MMLRKSFALLALLQFSCGKPDSGSNTQQREEKKKYLIMAEDDCVKSEKKLKLILNKGEEQNIDVGKEFANFYYTVSVLMKQGIDNRENLEYHCKKVEHYKESLKKKGLLFEENNLSLEVCQSKYFEAI